MKSRSRFENGVGRLIVLCLLIAMVEIQGVKYGPSMEFLTRGGNQDSSKTKGKTLYLSAFPWKSVVIPLIDNEISADAKTAYRFFHRFHFAQFFVEAPANHGIMAVIQTLKLDTAHGTNSKCLDHVQFTDLRSGKETPPICGFVNSSDHSEAPETLIGPRFFSSHHEMAVEIFILSTSLRSSNASRTRISFSQNLMVEIAFTAYSRNPDCMIYGENDTSLANGKPEAVNTATCSPSSPEAACISRNVFCNGVLNCAGTEANGTQLVFGLDEQNCSSLSALEADFYDIDEKSVQAEVKYRERLVENDVGDHADIVHYAVLGLSCTVIGILIFSCCCYWGIWLFPAKRGDDDEVESENKSKNKERRGDDTSSIASVESSKTNEDSQPNINLGLLGDLELEKRLQRDGIPAKLTVNPDGSHSIVSYHGGRRLTISLS